MSSDLLTNKIVTTLITRTRNKSTRLHERSQDFRSIASQFFSVRCFLSSESRNMLHTPPTKLDPGKSMLNQMSMTVDP